MGMYGGLQIRSEQMKDIREQLVVNVQQLATIQVRFVSGMNPMGTGVNVFEDIDSI